MRLLSFVLLLCLAGCQAHLPALPAWQLPSEGQAPGVGQIIDLRSGQALSPAQLVEQLADAPQVLVGERHDNPDHHALQLWLLQALASQRGQGSLLLEMLTPSQQAQVDGVRPTLARGEAVTDLAAALSWEKGWDWALYGPVVRYALAQPYPLRAANLDRAEVMAIYRAVPPLKGAAASAPAVREALLAQIRTSHCDLLPESQLPAMLAVQQQRDLRMAQALQAAATPSLLFAGAYHVRRDLGAPLHLRDLGLPADERVLILAEAGKPVSAAMADYVWYTPGVAEQDLCAQLRR
ncbi:Uncharacterized iron-regulated protein [Pseudomonas cuatrocienegasensis]|uniref:Uncharacterized iron-regulated protein n=1 Tax=Pseudomonas cuatrocienegasensis TaxID=543360 RepID=A0ABY1BLL8_9PSED|nr:MULTISPECIES: ChaN family lipoprotein [Pseudomonas]OEC33078.1 iron(III) ABC transporter [Pseudomonas sp. 21C1]SER12123.1 Uncharacterized iron-regulated protein [Pseudomonas cuatrocienegasensis]